MPPPKQVIDELTKKLIDQGLIIEAGWVSLSIVAIPSDASPHQLEAMRDAFFAGAHHLWASVNSAMTDDEEPTPDDLRRMELIDNELRRFIEGFEQKHKLS